MHLPDVTASQLSSREPEGCPHSADVCPTTKDMTSPKSTASLPRGKMIQGSSGYTFHELLHGSSWLLSSSPEVGFSCLASVNGCRQDIGKISPFLFVPTAASKLWWALAARQRRPNHTHPLDFLQHPSPSSTCCRKTGIVWSQPLA